MTDIFFITIYKYSQVSLGEAYPYLRATGQGTRAFSLKKDVDPRLSSYNSHSGSEQFKCIYWEH